MATTKEFKKEVKIDRPKMNFAFGKKNYTFLIAGIVLLIIGYYTLSGGGSADPNQFSDALFSPRRMVLAPIILMLGYVTVGYAIMLTPDEEKTTQEETK